MDTGEAANAARPVGGGRAAVGVLVESPAYRGGWRDGRFGLGETLSEDRKLGWDDADRLAYYRGYREGLRVRKMLA